MKIVLLLFAVLLSFTDIIKAQCSPNFLFTVLSLPGVINEVDNFSSS